MNTPRGRRATSWRSANWKLSRPTSCPAKHLIVYAASAVAVPVVLLLIQLWESRFSLPLIGLFMTLFWGFFGTLTVLAVLTTSIRFIIKTIIFIGLVFKRALSGIIGSVGLLIAVIAFVERVRG
jgi:hypothetical protein